MGGSTGGSGSLSPQQLMDEMGQDVGVEIPPWVAAITPSLEKFYKTAISDRDFPIPIGEKPLRNAINVMAKTAYEIILRNVNDPADLFMIDADGMLEKSWQGLIDWAESYTPEISKVTATIGRPERAAFGRYEADLRGRFTELAEGKGFAVEKMQADFRESMKEFDDLSRQKIQAFNRFTSGDPRLRKSMMVDLVVSRGGWEEGARDRNLSRQAEARLKSEFFGNEKLLQLADLATREEATANQMNLAADELGLRKNQLEIERDRILSELTLRGKSLTGEFIKGSTGLQIEKNRATAMNEAARGERLSNLMNLLGFGTSMDQFGKKYALAAAGGAGGLVGSGLNYATDVYKSDISKFMGHSETEGAPIWSTLLGAGIGAAGQAYGGYLSRV